MDGEDDIGIDWSLNADNAWLHTEPGFSVNDHGQEPGPLVDWDSLQVQETNEEHGRMAVCNEQQLYVLLGLRDEDEPEHMAPGGATNSTNNTRNNANMEGTEGAAILVDDYIPEETVFVYDKDNPSMALGTLYHGAAVPES